MSDWSLLETQWVQVSETDAWALGARPARASDAARASGRVRIGQRYERPTDLSVSPQSQPTIRSRQAPRSTTIVELVFPAALKSRIGSRSSELPAVIGSVTRRCLWLSLTNRWPDLSQQFAVAAIRNVSWVRWRLICVGP